jgi:hypothetical protein
MKKQQLKWDELNTGTVKSSLKEDLSKLCGVFKDNEWCNDCRDWYKSELKECPDCENEEYRMKYKEAIKKIKDQFTNLDYCLIDPQEKLENIFKICLETEKDLKAVER